MERSLPTYHGAREPARPRLEVLVCPYARSLGLKARQNTPAIDAAFYRPIDTSYQLQSSFHTHWTEPEPTARARRAEKEFYETTPEFMFVYFRLLGVESIQSVSTFTEPSLLIRMSRAKRRIRALAFS